MPVFIWLLREVAKPYMSADNQFWKIYFTEVEPPILSYIQETERGASSIRAFGQEEKINKKQF